MNANIKNNYFIVWNFKVPPHLINFLSPRGEDGGEGANLVFIRVYSWINSCIFVEICVHSC